MSYYSNLEIDDQPYFHHDGFTSPRQQLLQRWHHLRHRLAELKSSHAPYSSAYCPTESTLRYTLPESFFTVYEVETAIHLTVKDLKDKYGMDIHDETGVLPSDEAHKQLSLFEIVLLHPLAIPAQANTPSHSLL